MNFPYVPILLQRLVNSNFDRLQEGLTEKQKELLMRYAESRNEFSNINELDAFQTGFRLGAQIIIEVLKYKEV